MNQNRKHSLSLHHGLKSLRIVGLMAIALFTFHALSSLVFSVLGLFPDSPDWGLALTLAGFLALAATSMGLQSIQVAPPRLTGLASGAASGGILLFYSIGQMTDQNPTWAIGGAVIGFVMGGVLGVLSGGRPGFWRVAIALSSTLCAYGLAFGLGTWTLAAMGTGRWLLSIVLGSLTFLYLWFTRRSLTWIVNQWKRLESLN
ncbi:MAG: hypothetical protein AAF821_11560 [Cyanobacteria bacterium P01_D01_bin.156]